MTMTQASALTSLRLRLDETTAHVWTDPELRGIFNEITRDIARRTESLRTKKTFVTTADIGEYKCPKDCFKIHHLEYTDNSFTYTPDYVDRNALSTMWGGSQDQTGIPAVYTVWGYPPDMRLRFYPVPSGAATVTVFYYKIPGELTTADTTDAAVELDIPAGWDDIALDGAESKALRKSRDQRWQEAETLYQQRVNEMIDTTMRYTDQAGQMTWDGTPGWLTSFDGW